MAGLIPKEWREVLKDVQHPTRGVIKGPLVQSPNGKYFIWAGISLVPVSKDWAEAVCAFQAKA